MIPSFLTTKSKCEDICSFYSVLWTFCPLLIATFHALAELNFSQYQAAKCYNSTAFLFCLIVSSSHFPPPFFLLFFTRAFLEKRPSILFLLLSGIILHFLTQIEPENLRPRYLLGNSGPGDCERPYLRYLVSLFCGNTKLHEVFEDKMYENMYKFMEWTMKGIMNHRLTISHDKLHFSDCEFWRFNRGSAHIFPGVLPLNVCQLQSPVSENQSPTGRQITTRRWPLHMRLYVTRCLATDGSTISLVDNEDFRGLDQ